MSDENPLQAWLDDKKVSQLDFGKRVGCSGVHIHRICNDDQRVSPDLAVRIFKETGVKVGPLRNATPDDAEAFVRVLTPEAVAP